VGLLSNWGAFDQWPIKTIMILNHVFSFLQVPFGSAPAVRDWMQLQGDVEKPSQELKSREVVGLVCPREEESGKRFWGVARKLSGTPEQFFKNAFVYNLCPLAFFGGSPRSYKNVTPAEIKV
jgi:single-strand selective monofunctional uracil DNA glycosylase